MIAERECPRSTGATLPLRPLSDALRAALKEDVAPELRLEANMSQGEEREVVRPPDPSDEAGPLASEWRTVVVALAPVDPRDGARRMTRDDESEIASGERDVWQLSLLARFDSRILRVLRGGEPAAGVLAILLQFDAQGRELDEWEGVTTERGIVALGANAGCRLDDRDGVLHAIICVRDFS